VASAIAVVSAAAPASAAPGDTTTTFAVTGGALSISVPATVSLGSGAAGSTISGQLGAVTVSDLRGAVLAAWTASVSSTDFTTGTATTAETVLKASIAYWSGPATTTTGAGVATPGQATSTSSQTMASSRTAFSKSAGSGNNTASWDPGIVVTVGSGNLTGTYTGTITHSVA
ncbi:MAG: hypothetical protein WCB04_13680, partial [Mycobacteriales bacterium]